MYVPVGWGSPTAAIVCWQSSNWGATPLRIHCRNDRNGVISKPANSVARRITAIELAVSSICSVARASPRAAALIGVLSKSQTATDLNPTTVRKRKGMVRNNRLLVVCFESSTASRSYDHKNHGVVLVTFRPSILVRCRVFPSCF